MLRAYKGNTPVSVQEECVFVQEIKGAHRYGCVYVCIMINDPDNKKRAPRCTCVCAREIKDGCVYARVCHFPSPINVRACACVRVCVCACVGVLVCWCVGVCWCVLVCVGVWVCGVGVGVVVFSRIFLHPLS